MLPSTRTPEGQPNCCPVCGHEVRIEPSIPPGDATCPFCGHLLWFPEGRLFRCFGPDGKPHDIQATTKAEVIKEMVGALVSSGRVPAEHAEEIVESIMKREDLGSTGIGGGVAVPHTKQIAITEFTGLIGRSRSGVDFDSLDGEPAYRVVLLISPPDRPGEHLRMLEAVGRLFRDGDFPWS